MWSTADGPDEGVSAFGRIGASGRKLDGSGPSGRSAAFAVAGFMAVHYVQ
jgi:hypothetical protein